MLIAMTPSLPRRVRALSLPVSPRSVQRVRSFHFAHVFLTGGCDRRQLMSTKALETQKKKALWLRAGNWLSTSLLAFSLQFSGSLVLLLLRQQPVRHSLCRALEAAARRCNTQRHGGTGLHCRGPGAGWPMAHLPPGPTGCAEVQSARGCAGQPRSAARSSGSSPTG